MSLLTTYTIYLHYKSSYTTNFSIAITFANKGVQSFYNACLHLFTLSIYTNNKKERSMPYTTIYTIYLH